MPYMVLFEPTFMQKTAICGGNALFCLKPRQYYLQVVQADNLHDSGQK